MKNLTKHFLHLFPALLLFLVSVSPVGAFFVQSGATIDLPKDKVINEAAFITGSTLSIDADINGDLYCAGQNIVINGDIKGDVACLGQTIKINGTVDGDVRVLGQTISIAGLVNRNLTVLAQELLLGSKSQVKGDLFFGGQNVQLQGLMGRDLAGAGQTITISGSLLRNAVITGEDLSLANKGKIGGNLDYYQEKTATASVAIKNVKGTITRHDITTPPRPEVKKDVVKVSGLAMVIKTVFGIISFALLGLVLIYFDRKNTESRIAKISTKPVVTGLIGLAILIVAPFAFFLLLMTAIGIPIAFVAMFVFIIALITASLYPSAIFGKLFFEKLLKKGNISLSWQMVTGVALLGLVSCIPVVGWSIAFVSFCMGIGAFLVSLLPEKK
jgi:cytoskeletal protein CcmA (bactofilin family)